MANSGKASADAVTIFHKTAIALLVAGTATMFALGALKTSHVSDPVARAGHGEDAKSAGPGISQPGAGEASIDVERLAKPVDVSLASTTGKLWDLFRTIGYEIDGVRVHGEVPRLFLASLPQDLRHEPRADLRKTTFIKSTLPLILHVNELILQDRARLVSLRDQAAEGRLPAEEDQRWLEEIADRYGSQSADPAVLLTHVDIVPPSLAIAQAAEESGWGTSRFAREGNALFGQRAYKAHKKGIVPMERAEGKSFRVRGFDHLIDG